MPVGLGYCDFCDYYYRGSEAGEGEAGTEDNSTQPQNSRAADGELVAWTPPRGERTNHGAACSLTRQFLLPLDLDLEFE